MPTEKAITEAAGQLRGLLNEVQQGALDAPVWVIERLRGAIVALEATSPAPRSREQL